MIFLSNPGPLARKYAHIHRPDGTIYDSGQQILDNLAHDPYGIALSNVRYLKDNAVKPLALARALTMLRPRTH